MRHYRDGTPEPLRSQIDDFLYQESMHSREHAAFNRQAQDVGYWPQLDGQRRWLNSAIMVQEMRVFGVRRAIENLHSLQRDNARPFEFFA